MINIKMKWRKKKTDKEIKDLFHAPEEVTVRRNDKGWVDQVNTVKFTRIINKYEE